jgi:hypothetical protein
MKDVTKNNKERSHLMPSTKKGSTKVICHTTRLKRSPTPCHNSHFLRDVSLDITI